MSTILFILLMFRLVGRYARDVPISIPWYLPNDEESYYHSEGAVLAPSYHFIAGATISPHYCVRLIATPYFRGSRASHDCYLAGATIIREWCAKRMPPLLPSWGIVSMEMLWLAIFGALAYCRLRRLGPSGLVCLGSPYHPTPNYIIRRIYRLLVLYPTCHPTRSCDISSPRSNLDI